MTPKEKAHALFIDYRFALSFPGAPLGDNKDIAAKKCAEILVNEILTYDLNAKSEAQFVIERRIEEYWGEVKKELESF